MDSGRHRQLGVRVRERAETRHLHQHRHVRRLGRREDVRLDPQPRRPEEINIAFLFISFHSLIYLSIHSHDAVGLNVTMK